MNTLPWTTYRDRVLGCWLGKCVAGTLGAPYEGWKGEMDLRWDPAAVATTLPNDDLDLQVLWLDVLERVGVEPTSDDLAAAFDACCPYDPGEYGILRKNWRRGIHPPLSGSFNNRYYQDGMGCPIRSEIWACICPGQPDLAARYAAIDGIIDHADASVRFEEYLAAIEAELLVGVTVPEALRRNLRFLPVGSRARAVVEDSLRWSEECSDWRIVRRRILRDYGHPDCTNSFQNLGFTILALVHGHGDFVATSMIALNCGYDTDCTCATAGAILGAALGADELQRRHAFPDAGFRLGVRVERRSDRLDDLTDDTCRVGLAVAAHHGGFSCSGAPAAPVLPRRSPAPTLAVAYLDGPPVIAPGETRRLAITVGNPGVQILSTSLELAGLPPGWTASWTRRDVAVPPTGTMVVPLAISVDGAVPELNECNLLELRLGSGGSHRFGLNGAQLWRVWGPFWEQHVVMPPLVLGEGYGQHLVCLPGACPTDLMRQVHLNVAVDGELAYPLDGEARTVAVREDRFAVEDVVGCQGPCVVYLERQLTSAVARDVHLCIGHSDAYTLWLDGQLLDHQDGCDWWTAENRHLGPIHLRAGVTRLRLRLVRRTHSAWFSLMWMDRPTMGVQVHDLGSRVWTDADGASTDPFDAPRTQPPEQL
jgi:ADP-ribosylglycohydrolase